MSMNLENRISNEQLVDRIQAGEGEKEKMLQLWQQNRGFIATMAGSIPAWLRWKIWSRRDILACVRP